MRDSYRLYQDKLAGEYAETFEQIRMYFSMQQVDDDTEEEYMGALLDVFLSAQEEGKLLERIVGKNIEGFCKSFCSNLTWQQKVLNVLDQFKTMAWFTFLFSTPQILFFLEDLINGKINIFALTSDINIFGYILGFSIVFIVSAITSAITKKVMFKIKRISMVIWKYIVAALAIASFFIYFVLIFGDSTWDIPLWIAALVSGVYLLLYYVFNKDRLKARRENKVSFWDEVGKNVNTDDIFAEEMEKKWEKKNKKLLKKGKKALTREEILLAEEAECYKDENFKIWHYMLPLIISMVICVVFSIWLEIPFEERSDMLWFWGILLVIEYVFMILLRKMAHSGLVNRRRWIETERKKLENVDVEMHN